MFTILRLEGLDVKAGLEDIRSFFRPLHIPDGRIYIVGGNLREAFIAFINERDAQLAMRQNGNILKGSRVTLYNSSLEEMEQILEPLVNKPNQSNVVEPQSDANLTSSPHKETTADLSPSAEYAHDPISPNVPDLNSLPRDPIFVALLQSLLLANSTTSAVESNKADNTGVSSEGKRKPQWSLKSTRGYVRLIGLPAATTKKDICDFFRGLNVKEVIVNLKVGVSRCCLVKFAKEQDASYALSFNGMSLGSAYVAVRAADKKMWTSALRECERALGDVTQKHGRRLKSTNKRESGFLMQRKRQASNPFPLEPSKREKPDSSVGTSSLFEEYIVMVRNLPTTVTKTELKEFFRCPNIPHKNVLHLLNEQGFRTDRAFLIFDRMEEFNYAMNLSGCCVGSHAIEVSSITRENMQEMLLKNRSKSSSLRDPRIYRQRKSSSVETEMPPSAMSDRAAQTCIYVRNMPAYVKKNHVRGLFWKFEVKKDDIVILRDHIGTGSGEAVVKFPSEQQAAQAQMMHGKEFLGNQVILTLINEKQMEEILRNM